MKQKSQKKASSAFLGTVIEYYDYSLYGFCAKRLASEFIPNIDEMSSLLSIFAAYAVSYIAKPMGSIFFSRIGDMYGRIVSLRCTIIGIAFPTLLIGLLPGYDYIGLMGYKILILCRFFQGFFAAGEYDGAAIYTIEHIGEKYHYTASSITRTSGVFGLLLGVISSNFFCSSIFPDWGWRIPFLLSFPFALVTLYYRSFLEETPCFINNSQNSKFTPTFSFIRSRWKNLIPIIMLAGGFGVTYQVCIIFMKQYLPMVVKSTSSIMTTFSVLIVFLFGVAMPVSGVCADKFGVKIVMKYSLVFTFLSCILFVISITKQLVNLTLFSCLLLAASVSPFNALAHGVAIKIFKTNERYRGVSLGHTIGSMLMSSTANYVSILAIYRFNLTLFPLFYVCFFAAICYFSVVILLNSVSSNKI